MEIVKHGNTYRRYKCLECGCEFFSSKEERHTSKKYETCSVIYCPECGSEAYLYWACQNLTIEKACGMKPVEEWYESKGEEQ